jgi:hypothetical protein
MPFAHDSERSHQHEPVGVVFLEPSYIVIVSLDLIQDVRIHLNIRNSQFVVALDTLLGLPHFLLHP